MDLIIRRKNKETVEVELSRDGKVLDMLIIPLDFGFDTVLVTSIDKLLKKNRILRVSLSSINVEGLEDDSSMSSLVIRTVVEALKIN